ncbi:hypothetical protein BU26DRAFT_263486 [Trematosphaeria pertusa]|uniref:Uncharacterized protein n=1 Tax=Trematosphaeria pertusa TaxID=390896 RepID=A0A6A6HQ18_9PLEO|nr:uncharacterized protein BU26DRAFT_263486 [Trematosphaeria pertusa]KAF2240215.1 hypothetical protein BU26DRAFT_263486 [Trematosphaeria pertusa]
MPERARCGILPQRRTQLLWPTCTAVPPCTFLARAVSRALFDPSKDAAFAIRWLVAPSQLDLLNSTITIAIVPRLPIARPLPPEATRKSRSGLHSMLASPPTVPRITPRWCNRRGGASASQLSSCGPTCHHHSAAWLDFPVPAGGVSFGPISDASFGVMRPGLGPLTGPPTAAVGIPCPLCFEIWRLRGDTDARPAACS